jgi:hypothetical protein
MEDAAEGLCWRSDLRSSMFSNVPGILAADQST